MSPFRDLLLETFSVGRHHACQHVAVTTHHHLEIFPEDILCRNGTWPFRDLLLETFSVVMAHGHSEIFPWDILCRDQGLFPSPGPSPINPHPGCGPRSIGLCFQLHLLCFRRCTSCGRWHLLGAFCRTSWALLPWPRWPTLGLMNQMNIAIVGPHS